MPTELPLNFLRVKGLVSIILSLLLFSAPVAAQRPATVNAPAPPPAEPAFEDLLGADAYKLYGEIRNVGQLLSGGGAGEIVDPIIKLADPGREFKSIIAFLKKNSEALAASRLMFATWPARSDVPAVFVAIEFPTKEEATKFTPKLETFLPTILPPVQVTPEPAPASESTPAASPESAKPATTVQPTPLPSPAVRPSPPPPVERLPFVITHSGNLVFISDKAFKLEKLRPASSKALFYEPNFRAVHDKFSTEPIFFFFNVALEDSTRPKPSPTPVISEEERERLRQEEEAEIQRQIEEARAMQAKVGATPEGVELVDVTPGKPVLIAQSPSPSPTPTKEQQAQIVAGKQIEGLLDAIGFGEPQWPEAVGLAVELNGSEYSVRALLIDKPEAKRRPIPLLPQLLSGPPTATEVASVLPDDTEVFVSASIDLAQTYEGMRKAAETKAKTASKRAVYRGGVLVKAEGAAETDAFAEFEKKAGFNLKDELLPALGNEIALAGSLKTLQLTGGVNFGIRAASSSATGSDKTADAKKPEQLLPMLLIEVKDRDAVRRLMPKVLNGLGIGEANLFAQTERRGDAEIINYAGVFAYGFVGSFMVISDAAAVRRLVDANVNNQTLSSNTVFRNSRRWQSNRTLGQIYVSPALMAGYHEEIRKQAGAMDETMRDFLLSLDPRSEAITYALSNDGSGALHELHLPKNLILTMVAGISSAARNPPPEANEGMAIGLLQYVSAMEAQYKDGPGKGSYGSMQQLVDAKIFPPNFFDQFQYKIEIMIAGDGFEAVAAPREYGKSGKRSFFVDKSGVVRGGDHGGGPATVADPPAQP